MFHRTPLLGSATLALVALSACGGPAFSAGGGTDAATDGPTGDAGVMVLASGGQAGKGITVDPTRVYWVDQDPTGTGTVNSVLKDGGSFEQVAMDQPSPLDVGYD